MPARNRPPGFGRSARIRSVRVSALASGSTALTFLVTLSGVTLWGIGSAFWGVLAGSVALAVIATCAVIFVKRGRGTVAPGRVERDLAQWAPLLAWLDEGVPAGVASAAA